MMQDLTPEEQRIMDKVISLLLNRLSGSSEEVIGIQTRVCGCGQKGESYLQLLHAGHMSKPNRIHFCEAHFEELYKTVRVLVKENLASGGPRATQ